MTQGGWATAQVAATRSSHGEPQTTPPTTKWGQGPREEAFPRRAQRPPAGPSGGLAGLPACRDAEAPATPLPPGGPSPAARPPRPPPPSGRAAGLPSADFLPRARGGRRRRRDGGDWRWPGRSPARAGRGRGGGGALRGAARARSPGTPPLPASTCCGERAGGRRRSVLAAGPAASETPSPRCGSRVARRGPAGAGALEVTSSGHVCAGRRAPARDPGGRRAGCDPAG